jgi:hypothetical protein
MIISRRNHQTSTRREVRLVNDMGMTLAGKFYMIRRLRRMKRSIDVFDTDRNFITKNKFIDSSHLLLPPTRLGPVVKRKSCTRSYYTLHVTSR